MRFRIPALLIVLAAILPAQRARDLGVPFSGAPGGTNSIVDVPGVTVGHTTLIEGSSVRTGVTAVWPRGKETNDPVFAGWWSLNGNGEMTGTTWIEESGFLDGPVLLTNTHSVGVVRDAFIQWQVGNKRTPGTNVVRNGAYWSMPVVAETFDGFLNDTNGFHVNPGHVRSALESASASPPGEGSVGGGTGMICFGYKGGIGTASRRVGDFTVGVLVQCNCGTREQLRIAGVPISPPARRLAFHPDQPGIRQELGSIIIVVATDAPLLPHQTKRLARRASLGLGRMGATSSNFSGDIFIAFSTANAMAASSDRVTVTMLANHALDPVFTGAVEAVEEAIANAMIAARTMTGRDKHTVEALPHTAVEDAMRKHGLRQRN